MFQLAQLQAARYRLRELQQRGEVRALQRIALQAASDDAPVPVPSVRVAARRVRAAFPTGPAAAAPSTGAGTCAVSAPAGCCASPA